MFGFFPRGKNRNINDESVSTPSTGEGHAEPSLGLNLLRNHHEREVSWWSFDI